MTGKSTALALDSLRIEPAAVALQGVLDDGQSQSGATLSARTSRVHPIETLRQPRNVFRGDADAAVDDGEIPALLIGPPTHAYSTLRVGVFQRIDQQICECGFNLVRAPVQAVAGFQVQ